MKNIIGIICFPLMIYTLTNKYVKQCITNEIQEEGSCKTQFQDCFENEFCSKEFDLLFEMCYLDFSEDDYDPFCAQEGAKISTQPQLIRKILIAKVLELMNCFDSKCNLLNGLFSGQQTQEVQQTEEVKQEKKVQYQALNQERNKQKASELEICMQEALVIQEKCGILMKDCDDECIESFSTLEECKLLMSRGSLEDGKDCFINAKFQNRNSQSLRDCLLENCFQDKLMKKKEDI